MKRILMAFGFLMLMTTSTIAGHLGAPVVDQERDEKIWSCLNIENTKKFADTSSYINNKKSSDDWASEMSYLVRSGECVHSEITYVVREVLATFDSFYRTRSGWSDDKIFFYLLRVDTKDSKDVIIATY